MNRQRQSQHAGLAANPSPTLAEQGYNQLKQQILSATLEPGQPLRLERLRTSLGIGYTPLREALMRLSSEGFVDMEGQRGFRVAPISLQSFADITNARVSIEALALTRALEVGDDNWEASIVANFHRLSRRTAIDPETGLISAEWDSAHRDFHYSLISGCDNEWLKHFWQILFDQAFRYRQLAVTRGYQYRDDLSEHKNLMEQVLDHNLSGLLQASEAHIRGTYDVVLKVLANSEQQTH